MKKEEEKEEDEMGFCYKVKVQFNLHNKIKIILKHK